MSIAAKLRAAMRARADRELGWLQAEYPWTAGYDILPPRRGWRAVHTASGTEIGPVSDVIKLEKAILADHQSRPIRPSPVPYRPPGAVPGHPARHDIPAWPIRRRRDAS